MSATVLNKHGCWQILEKKMKKLVIAAGLTVLAGAAFAGGMSEPMMEETVVAEMVDTATGGSSSGGIIVPLLILALIGAAVSK